MAISSTINYVKENPFFVVGCVASAVSNPVLFGVSAWAGVLLALFNGEEKQLVKNVPQSNLHGPNYESVMTVDTFIPFEIGRVKDLKSIASISSICMAVANKVQALKTFNLLKFGMVSSCFSGFLLGGDLINHFGKINYAKELQSLRHWQPNNDIPDSLG